MSLTRRTLLGSAAASLAVLGGTRLVLAGNAQSQCRFLFINAEGGWDPLAVFAPLFGATQIDMEPEAEPWTIGGLSLVDSPLRPMTRAFFEAHHAEVALLNGVSTRSVNHEICQVVALTGSTSEDRPDWATILGYEERDSNSLPHLVVSGPSFTGDLSVFVSNAEGLLQPAIDGSILQFNDNPVRGAEAAPSRIVDRFLEQRGAARALLNEDSQQLTDYREALRRAKSLTDSRLELELVAGEDFRGRLDTAISALGAGLSRCASVGTGFIWDTHEDNSLQSGLFENFFTALDQGLASLSSTLGPEGNPLSQDTIVVVTSEMARTPAYNGTGGRDHWPYTSMMLMGPGIAGNRSFGGYTDLYTGIGVDSGGAPDPSQPGISAESLGATLLTLGDIDPAQYVRGGAVPIGGLLA